MLILLPPSETKTRPVHAEAAPLDLDAFGMPELTDSRRMMLRAAVRTAAARGGADKLGVPASSPELVERMAQLEEEPTDAPLSVYSGVLY
ncbi:MAG: peroxide stress protein YaaA, partial [Dermabacteraceae bacterium]